MEIPRILDLSGFVLTDFILKLRHFTNKLEEGKMLIVNTKNILRIS